MNIEKEIKKLVEKETESNAIAPSDVPDYIAQSAQAIKEHGYRYADVIEKASTVQFEADKKRHDETLELVKTIRNKAEAEAEHVREWAMKTHDANREIQLTLGRLNGKLEEVKRS